MTIQLKVPSVVCEGCAETITHAITELDSTATVKVNQETKQVEINTQTTEAAVQEAIASTGHTIE
ncbi:MAG: copper chaperone [Cyanobacteria bacterium QS_4_48_99]|nr:MAG: copper chaperone [Cyanobacteria bacterium QS_1_48_34]PSO83295.1 MAG: copper chaperone [Cyanobacteria bacterium QS_4_48_99]